MIYEYRKYVSTPGKLGAVHKIFEEPILRLFERHGMDVLGFWTTLVGDSTTSALHYILRWQSMSAMQKAWEEFYADPEWAEAAGASAAADGPTVASVRNQIWKLTPYSPEP